MGNPVKLAKALLRSAAQAAARARAAAQPSRITIGCTVNLIITPAVRNLRHQHPDADVHTLHLAEASSRGACACRADLAAAGRSVGRLGLATTTTGAEANKLCAVPSAITSGPPVSTDIADAWAGVRRELEPSAITHGYFKDPDGHLWEVAYNPGFPLSSDGSITVPDFGAS